MRSKPPLGLYANLYSIMCFSEAVAPLMETTTSHSTFGSEALLKALKFLQTRDDLYQILLQTYYIDYQEFSQFFTPQPTFACWLKNSEELLKNLSIVKTLFRFQ